nr:MAG TPA: hypothetical protein [Caudoviricetes sp.]
MTSSEIRQRLYIAMQEKNEYDKAFEIIKVFNESYKDTKEENKFALGIRDELKKLYYQWVLAVKELNGETDWDIPENLFVFLVRKLSKSNVARIMGWDKVPLKKCPLFDSIELIVETYQKMNSNG